MVRATALVVAITLALVALSSRPATAVCPPIDAWPPFTDIAEEARRVVIGTVSEASGGVATQLTVEEVLRGRSKRQLDLAVLRSRLGERGHDCPFQFTVEAEVGDRLALALSGRTDVWRGKLDSVALLDADGSHPNASGLQRLTTPQARLLLGHEANGSTIDRPGNRRPQSTESLVDQLLRALPGSFLQELMPWLEEDVPD